MTNPTNPTNLDFYHTQKDDNFVSKDKLNQLIPFTLLSITFKKMTNPTNPTNLDFYHTQKDD